MITTVFTNFHRKAHTSRDHLLWWLLPVRASFLKAEPAELISSALLYRQANVRGSERMSSGLKGQY